MSYNWLEKWKNNDIVFHLTTINPLLEHCWPHLLLPDNATVFVPLCGKTLDMLWLAKQGYHIVGVELSEIACKAFFIENNLAYQIEQQASFVRYYNDDIEIYCGDFFALDKNQLPIIDAIYDRAALVALPPELRQRYAQHLLQLMNANTQMLLIVCDSKDDVRGPPNPISSQEVNRLYSKTLQVTELVRCKREQVSQHFYDKGYREIYDVAYYLSNIS